MGGKINKHIRGYLIMMAAFIVASFGGSYKADYDSCVRSNGERTAINDASLKFEEIGRTYRVESKKYNGAKKKELEEKSLHSLTYAKSLQVKELNCNGILPEVR